MLRVVDLSKNYTQGPRNLTVLKNLDLEIKSGQKVAIVGQSGSGKSTLLGLLAGLDRPDHGEIHLDQTRFSSLSEEGLTRLRAEKIGIVFQQFHLLPSLTAWENAALPLEFREDPDAREKAMDALSQVGLENRLDHFPHQLSGGEMQRVAITRSILAKPKLLLADEPTGNLDQKTGRGVMDMLIQRTEEENLALLLVTHNHALADECDEKLFLFDGRLNQEEA